MWSATASTSRSLCVMKMIDLPLLDQAAHDAEELVDLARREHGGGLVEDEDVGVAVERLDQLDALLLADRQRLHEGVGVDLEPVLRARARGCGRGRGRGRAPGPRRGSLPSTMFSTTVNTGMSWKCWCTIPIPAAIASRGAAELRRARRAGGSAPSSGWYSPNTVFTSVLLPAPFSPRRQRTSPSPQRQVDVLVGDDPGEPLGETPDLEDRLGGLAHGPPERVVVARAGAAWSRPLPGVRPLTTAAARWPGRGRS